MSARVVEERHGFPGALRASGGALPHKASLPQKSTGCLKSPAGVGSIGA